MTKSLTEMAAEIVAAQAGHAAMSAGEMDAALKKAFDALKSIKAIEEGVEAEPTPVDPKKSIRKNKVICLECGKEFKMLGNRHLKEHGLDAKEYRKKYGFRARQPLTAKSLSKKRSKTAKALGLGERLQEALQKSRKAKEKPPAEKAKAKAPVKKKAKAKPAKPAQKKVIRRRKKAKTAPA
jgi:predicted transcriptional regulator